MRTAHTGGWIAAVARTITPHGSKAVNSPIPVDEPAGFDGERVTPAGQHISKVYPTKFTVLRNGRTVYATRELAGRTERMGALTKRENDNGAGTSDKRND